MAGEPIKLKKEEVEKWKDSPQKQKVLAELKKQEQPVQQKPQSAPAKKQPEQKNFYQSVKHQLSEKGKRQFSREEKGESPKPKSRWESVKERILGNKEGKEKRERRPERSESRGRVSSRSIYKDGKLVEKIHYGPAHPPAQKQPKPHKRRGDPLGGIGAGLKFDDFLPSNRGVGLGGMIQDPFTHPADSPAPRRRGKRGRRPAPREEPFDYLDHINQGFPKTWKGKF